MEIERTFTKFIQPDEFDCDVVLDDDVKARARTLAGGEIRLEVTVGGDCGRRAIAAAARKRLTGAPPPP